MFTVFYNHVQEAMKQENMTLEEVAKQIKEHGITGLEFDYFDLINNESFDTELANKLRNLGIPIMGAYVNFDWGNNFWDCSYKKIYKQPYVHYRINKQRNTRHHCKNIQKFGHVFS